MVTLAQSPLTPRRLPSTTSSARRRSKGHQFCLGRDRFYMSYRLMESQPASEGFIPEHGGYEPSSPTKRPASSTMARCGSANGFGPALAHRGPDGAGGPFRKTEHRGREPRLRYFQRGGAEAPQCGPRERDYLRTRGHALWDKNSNQALFVRKLGRKDQGSYEAYREFLETRPADVCTSILICLICSINCSGSLSEPFSKKAGCGNGCSAPARKRGRRNRSTTTTAARLSSTGRSGKF